MSGSCTISRRAVCGSTSGATCTGSISVEGRSRSVEGRGTSVEGAVHDMGRGSLLMYS